MSAPDFYEDASKLVFAIEREGGSCDDEIRNIAQGLRVAYAAGRRDGIEAAAKVAETERRDYACMNHDDCHVWTANLIRALGDGQ